MNCLCSLKRNKFGLYGIFGELFDNTSKHICYTLEHAFLQPDGSYLPKIASGTYTCKKGTGPLPGGLWKLDCGKIINTFQVMDVPKFMGNPVTNILIHLLNYNNQTKGCIGVGLELGVGCILESEKAFDAFMALQEGVDSFTLLVS